MALELSVAQAAMQLTGTAVLVAVGAAALGQAPRDMRTRVFFALATASGVAATIPVALWFLEVREWDAFGRVPLALTLAAYVAGELLLFHFAQVFPQRRPWIRSAGRQLPIAYLLAPAATGALTLLAPTRMEGAPPYFIAAFVVFGFPLLVLIGVILPVATLVSLVRSTRDTADDPRPPDLRVPLSAMVLSVLATLVEGLFSTIAGRTDAADMPAAGFPAVVGWVLSLLFPLAYAAAIWVYGALEMPVSGSAEMKSH